MKAKPKTLTIAEKVLLQQRALEAGKAGYKRADALLDELILDMGPGAVVRLPDGTDAVLVDKLKDKTYLTTGMKARRFEIEIRRADDITNKL